MQLTEENQFVGIEGQADFFREFAAGGLCVRLVGPHVAGGGRIEAAEIGIAGTRAGLQQHTGSVRLGPGGPDEAEADTVSVAMGSGAVFTGGGITTGIEEGNSLSGHEAD